MPEPGLEVKGLAKDENRRLSVEEGRLILRRRESVEKKYAAQLYSITWVALMTMRTVALMIMMMFILFMQLMIMMMFTLFMQLQRQQCDVVLAIDSIGRREQQNIGRNLVSVSY